MEYGMTILGICGCVEIGFAIWSLTSKIARKSEKAVVRVAGFILLILLLLAGVLENMTRYGALIVLLGLQLLVYGIGCLLKKKNNLIQADQTLKKGRTIAVALGNILLYTFCLLPAFLFPQYNEPKVTGSLDVQIAEYTWVDEDRIETYTDSGENRALTVKFWYPEEEGSYPLVVFSHGAFGMIDSNYSTCMELASNGYVVASIAHPYHAIFVEDVNGNVTTVNIDFLNEVYADNGTKDSDGEKRNYEETQKWMEVRIGDENFVLDTILEKVEKREGAPFTLINAEKIGLFGHSMGGATSVHMGRIRDDIDAVIDLEGTMLGEYVDFKDGELVYNEEPYTVPVLDINSADIDRQARALEEQEYVNFYLGERALDYHYKVVEGAGHLNFTDLPMVSPFLANMLGVGDVDAKQCIEEINDCVLEFFDLYLK